MKKLWRKYKEFLGPAFIAFEALMHVYLVLYLTTHWTNWLVWSYTVFELTMFIYLLVTRRKKGGIQQA